MVTYRSPYRFKSRVEIHSTASGLDGETGTIVGVSSSHATVDFLIVLLDCPKEDYSSVVLISSCLKLTNR